MARTRYDLGATWHIETLNAKVVLVWWITCLIWSTVWLAIKLGVRDLPPFTFAGWRLVVALVLLTPVLLLKRDVVRETLRNWQLIAATGVVLLGVNYALVFWGAQYVSSGLTAVLQATTPAFGALLSYLILRERIRRNQIVGITIGILGVVLIFFDQLRSDGPAGARGAVAISAGAFCVALAYVVIARRAQNLSPLSVITGQMVAGAVPLIVAGAIIEGNPVTIHWTRTAIFALLYLAIAGSIAGFWLNYWLLRHAGTTSTLAISIVEPLFAVLLGAIVLHETLSWRVGVGGAAVVLSAWMVNARGTRVRK